MRNDHLNVVDYIVTECNLFQEKIKDIVDSTKISTLYLSYKNINYLEKK